MPQRTCVGCRRRVDRAELLRVVAVEGECVPDPRGRLPGRGASVHPDLVCFDLAERRQAFTRALRVPGPLDTRTLRAFVEEWQGATINRSVESEAGQEIDERSMSTQR
jgi:uncharacterized protein